MKLLPGLGPGHVVGRHFVGGAVLDLNIVIFHLIGHKN
jgi:hypothetical protein